ncbi:MAG: hypothetical protein IJW12_01675 [Opitutales bacterium]|nr:hypothetical protein [Opitutales bacterium]
MKISSLLNICTFFVPALALTACVVGESPTPDVNPTPEFSVPRSGNYKVLSLHDTDAVFAGTRKHVCMGRSMLCPDRCGHSGTLAVFKIEKYNSYSAPDKYGDPETSEFACMLKPDGSTEVAKEFVEKINALKPGDKVRLAWAHIYVSDPNGGNYPERVICELEKR